MLVELVYNNDFRDYLDQLIRMRVTMVQKSIWDYTKCILQQNPFDRCDDNEFYCLMVDQIYQRFLDIQQSSRQIQKIINVYLKLTYNRNETKQEIVYSNLAINTFNYLIETDQTLKNLIHICDKKISYETEIARKKLEELISFLDCYDDYQEEGEGSCESYQNDDLISTGHSEEDDFLQKKRRNKKVKESQLTTTEESLSKRLENLVVREEHRTPIRVSEEWLKKMKMKSLKSRTFNLIQK